MKRIISVVLLMFIAWGATAQITHTASGTVDEQAEKVLKQATAKFNSGASSFTVTLVNKGADQKESARMSARVVYKAGKFKVSYDQQVLLSDGVSLWQVNKEAREVTINKLGTGDDDLMNPGRLLANYQKNFKAKYIRQEEDGTAVIDLTPKKSKSYYKVRLFISSKSGNLKKMVMYNYDGSRGEYTLTGLAPAKVTDATFQYRAADYPGYEVIDMR